MAATPVPSSSLVPPPDLASYRFPTGRQVPEIVANSSKWSFPKDFMLGVAGAAFQVEGAAKDDGRGPSVWDKLVRVPGYTVANQTGDITDNHYYLYKQGEREYKKLLILCPYLFGGQILLGLLRWGSIPTLSRSHGLASTRSALAQSTTRA